MYFKPTEFHFKRRFAATLALACLIIAPVQAWGPLGHSVVAELAQRHLSPAAEAAVERLLSSWRKSLKS